MMVVENLRAVLVASSNTATRCSPFAEDFFRLAFDGTPAIVVAAEPARLGGSEQRPPTLPSGSTQPDAAALSGSGLRVLIRKP